MAESDDMMAKMRRFAESMKRGPVRMAKGKKIGRPGVWNAENDAKLGTKPDAVLAAELGVTQAAVTQRRKKLGVSPQSEHLVEWTEAMLGKLGVKTDAEIAREHAVAASTVTRKRRSLGIDPPAGASLRRGETVSDEVFAEMLSESSAAEVARRLGVSPQAVSSRRAKLGLDPSGHFFEPKSYHLYLLGKMTDREFADTFKTGEQAPRVLRRKHGIPPPAYATAGGTEFRSASHDPLSESTSTQDPPHPESQGRSTHEEF